MSNVPSSSILQNKKFSKQTAYTQLTFSRTLGRGEQRKKHNKANGRWCPKSVDISKAYKFRILQGVIDGKSKHPECQFMKSF